MAHQTLLRLAVYLVLASGLVVNAQENTEIQRTQPASKTKTQAKATKNPELDAVAAQRRVIAVSLITALADEARGFRDQTRRARVQAQAGDALWETDEDRARDLFRRAWEAAEIADTETAKQQTEDLRKQTANGGPVVLRSRPEVRNEVLRLVAKRDAKLGEEFLKNLSETSERETNEAAAELKRNSLNSFNASAGAARRLKLARQLLDDGDIERAIQFAGPVLDQVNIDSIFFLSALRTKNSQAADAGFSSLMARVARDPASDANTVAGLSSYLFTPFLYVTFSANGGSNAQQQRAATPPPPDLPKALRDTFFRVASGVLLRPSPPPDQDQTSAGRPGKYLVIKRLLPLFEQYAPERAPELRAQLSALASDVPDSFRQGENRAVTRGIVPEDTSIDPQQRMRERLDRAKTSDDRDVIYADYAVALAGKGDNHWRELVDKIEDTELRKRVRAHTDFQWAQFAIRNKDSEEAAHAAKSGDLTSIQRVWTYTRAARLLLKSDRARASQLLEEAATEARRIGTSDPDRARALVAVATVIAEVDRVRAWETVSEAVKAANSSEGFTGEDGSITARLQTRQMVEVTSVAAEDFDLLGAFRWLARDDLIRSIEQAKSFQSETPRAVATLAIARAVLEKGSTDSTAPPGQ
ncbi:MAG: hypothetical protein ACREBG_30115 [Pyrinomonadaceae bacterium]